jgi:flagellar motor switch protein FliN
MSSEPQAGGEAANPNRAATDGDASPFASLELQGAVPQGGDVAAETVEPPPDPARLELVFDVPVRLSVELGRTELPIRDVVGLGRGSVIELDRSPGAPLDVRVNGVLIGRGEIVVVNEERLGLRFVEVVSPADRLKRVSQ